MADEEQKPARCRHYGYALVYAAIIPVIQNIGRIHGYAIAVHGSMATDLDLIAVPWIENAAEPETLMDDIRERLNLLSITVSRKQPDIRPHGRLAWSCQSDPQSGYHVGGPYLDISVMPKIPVAEPTT